ncbi:hypothetical protein [Amycolatopsis arida]|uniref:hypothetical protein n=1 Tax=Amycolatopsis arida TaxID=587909 RepID=UPI001066A30F|nr:hypothetical protein [Amycolatopsis arida]
MSVSDDMFPPTAPAVPVYPVPGVDRAVVAGQWSDWLRLVVRRAAAREPADVRGDFFELGGWPELAAAHAALDEPMRNWERERVRDQSPPCGDLWLTEFVNGLAGELGRPVRPFALVITRAPVHGSFWHRRTPTHVLASGTVLADTATFRAAFAPVARELA